MSLKVGNCPCFNHGELAQLARALDLHSRGHRFDSDILHNSIEKFKERKEIVIQTLISLLVLFYSFD